MIKTTRRSIPMSKATFQGAVGNITNHARSAAARRRREFASSKSTIQHVLHRVRHLRGHRPDQRRAEPRLQHDRRRGLGALPDPARLARPRDVESISDASSLRRALSVAHAERATKYHHLHTILFYCTRPIFDPMVPSAARKAVPGASSSPPRPPGGLRPRPSRCRAPPR